MDKIIVETTLETKTLRVGEIVVASKECILLSSLNCNIKMRIISIIDAFRVRVRIISNNAFTNEHNSINERTGKVMTSAIVCYKKDILKHFEFNIGARYLDKIKSNKQVFSESFDL